MNQNEEVVFVTDIETYSQKRNAKVISIGVVALNQAGEEVDTFYEVIDASCMHNMYRASCNGTIEWWETIRDESPAAWSAIHDVMATSKLSLLDALEKLSEWLEGLCPDIKNRQIFGNGPEFDCEILKDAYDQIGIEVPWQFRRQQSMRTLVWTGRMLGIEIKDMVEENQCPHHALEDARFEARQIAYFMRHVGWEGRP